MADSAGSEARAGTEGAPEITIPQAIRMAVELYGKGFLEAADEICRRILTAVPDHVDALHLLGLSCHQQDKHDEALDLVQRAVARAPNHPDARNNLGNMWMERGRLDEAEASYRAVVALRPEHAGAHTNIGLLLRRKEDLVGAEAQFRRALALDPKHGPAYHNLGGVLQDTQRTDEALTVYQQALALMPYDGESYRRVGATLYTLGRIDDSIAIYARWVALEPDNPVAQHMLASASGRDVPPRASDGFVRGIFDGFAESFDAVLERLRYRAPALVGDAVATALGAPSRILDVLDAGAGTGLCGPLLRGYARQLLGIDLSAAMLAKARARAVYDGLEVAELSAYLRDKPEAFDLVVSADTLCYFGDLHDAISAAAVALRAGGHLVFTVEEAADAPVAGYRLNPHGRYSHTESHVRRALTAAGLQPLAMGHAHLRVENQLPVEGLVVTARQGDTLVLEVSEQP